MRVFWSVVLTGGLLLVGFDVFQLRVGGESVSTGGRDGVGTMSMEDGSGFPPTNPPPPPPPR